MLTDVDIYHAVAGLQDLRSLSVQSVSDQARPQEQVSKHCAVADDVACNYPLSAFEAISMSNHVPVLSLFVPVFIDFAY